MTALSEVFTRVADENRAALVGYLPAGFPSVDGAVDAAKAMVAAGVDVIEVGLPYSDPLLDGPTIQDAVHQALVRGVRVRDVLASVEAIAATGAATLIMTYWNPVDHYGVDAFARDLAAAGGTGLITPDLTPEESGPWLAASDAHGLERVFLVAPTSTEERLAEITGVCRGFVYAASIAGVTGTRDSIGSEAADLVARTRQHTKLPVAVGLGIRDGAQAAEVAAYADGVIVGSAFVQRLLDAPDPASGVRAVADLAADLAAGVRTR